MICPISQGAATNVRSVGTVVTLMGSGTEIQGAVHCHQLKSLDWRVRKSEFKEIAPDFIMGHHLLQTGYFQEHFSALIKDHGISAGNALYKGITKGPRQCK